MKSYGLLFYQPLNNKPYYYLAKFHCLCILTLERPWGFSRWPVFSFSTFQLWFNIWIVLHCYLHTIMIINLFCIEKYLVNVFLIKYHRIYNILYNHKGLSSPSRVKMHIPKKFIFFKITIYTIDSSSFLWIKNIITKFT